MTDERIHALDIEDRDNLDEKRKRYLEVCEEKLGFVPNVLQAYAFDNEKLRTFADFYNDLMLGESGLSKMEREMIAVVVSSINHCFYCLAAHGAELRRRSNDPVLGEAIAANYRAADLSPRHKAMCDFAALIAENPDSIEEEDRQELRDAGFSDQDIWDIAAVASFYCMTNRMAAAIDMRPNAVYHGMAREKAPE